LQDPLERHKRTDASQREHEIVLRCLDEFRRRRNEACEQLKRRVENAVQVFAMSIGDSLRSDAVIPSGTIR